MPHVGVTKAGQLAFNTQYAWLLQRTAETKVETLDGPFLQAATGQEIKAVRLEYKIAEGTEATFTLQKKGENMAGFTALKAKTATAHVTPTAITLGAEEHLTLVIEAIVGTPKGLTVTLTMENIVSV